MLALQQYLKKNTRHWHYQRSSRVYDIKQILKSSYSTIAKKKGISQKHVMHTHSANSIAFTEQINNSNKQKKNNPSTPKTV